ncbi:hypothetical protein, partial [Xylophilus sp. Leaf220]|uniref:hypothetical protein n=1 Tax=Xylophilus sp. Leaf220 TaxID=1735686 RepID=UPI00191C1D75
LLRPLRAVDAGGYCSAARRSGREPIGLRLRTELFRADSLVAHHLAYKNESDVPKALMRKLSALSGLFETADDQFENLKSARLMYIESKEKEITEKDPQSLKANLNLDILMAYGKSKFPDRKSHSSDEFSELLSELQEYGYKNLNALEKAVSKGLPTALEEEIAKPPLDEHMERTMYSSIGLIRTSLSHVDAEYCLNKYGEDALRKNKERGLM